MLLSKEPDTGKLIDQSVIMNLHGVVRKVIVQETNIKGRKRRIGLVIFQ